MNDLAALVHLHRDEILKVAESHGARNVRIFGSVARGQADEKSDIDFLVDLDPGRSLFDLGGILHHLQALLNHSVDVVPADCLKKRIRERILKEAMLL